jgi:hypothetical protein
MKTNKILKQFQNHKGKTITKDYGIYKIKCNNCPLIYVGETGRSMQVRLKEHLYSIQQGNFDSSAVAAHAVFEDFKQNKLRKDIHTINKDIELIEKEPHYYRRKFKEALYIQQNPKALMNLDNGMKISPIWSSLLKDHLEYKL